MINSEQNPEFVNSFLDYSITILNKSPNSVKEYNYDLNMFLKYMKMHFKLTNETDFKKIYIKDFKENKIRRYTFFSFIPCIKSKCKTSNKSKKNIYNKNFLFLPISKSSFNRRKSRSKFRNS